MKTLDRYFFREHLGPFAGSLLVLTFILLLDRLFDLLNLLIVKGVPAATVGAVFLYSLPFILALTVPMAVLVASLVAYGHLVGDYELLALRALGIGVLRTLWGPFLFALLIFLGMSLFNNTVLPEANFRLKNLMLDIYQKRPASQIRAGVVNRVGAYLVFVERKDDRTSEVFRVIIQEAEGEGIRTIMAKKGKLTVIPDKFLIFDLEDGEIHEALGPDRSAYRKLRFREHRVKISLDTQRIRRHRRYRGDREKSARMLYEDIQKVRRNMEKVSDPGIRAFNQRRIAQLWVEIHKKFSLPAAALIFVFIAPFLSLRLKRGGYGAAFGISFVIFIVYYVFLIGGEELADRGLLNPALAMWFPNLFFLGLGLGLWWREERP